MTALGAERAFLLGGSLLVGVQAVNLLVRGLTDAPAATVAFVAIAAAFATWHGVLRYGLPRMIGFTLLAVAVSWGYETLSLLTGFPFGWYHYTDRIGPRIGLVPLVVPPVYTAMGYVSWTVAQALLSARGPSLSPGERIAVPLAAAFVMVLWHMPIDPVHATVGGYWVWRDGGPFFGVPLSNFAGWFLCVWTFFMAFAWMTPVAPTAAIAERRFFWLLPAGMYAAFVLNHLGALVAGPDLPVMTRDGRLWHTGDIYGAMALIALFTSLPVALCAGYRVWRDLPPAGAPRS